MFYVGRIVYKSQIKNDVVGVSLWAPKDKIEVTGPWNTQILDFFLNIF